MDDLVITTTNDVTIDPLLDLIHWTLVFIVTPSISILGIIGNTLNLFVFARHGFSKSSNILLFSLAISDILFLLGVNGPPKPMYEWGPGGFQFPEQTARALYYLYQMTDSLNWITGPISVFIPALVMIERLIAVFLPLHFPSIVTVRRTVIAVVTPFVISVFLQIYIRTWFQFVYIYDSAHNISLGVAMRAAADWPHRELARIIEIVLNSLFVLVIFVGCGCVALSVKLKMVARNRTKMTNNFKGPKIKSTFSRTTKMMLCLCVFYTLSCAPTILTAAAPHIMVYPIFLDHPNFRSMGVFIYHVYKLTFSVNASVNFLIYMLTNNKFRDTFLSLVCCKQHHRSLTGQ